jgi:hypothetical protein
VSQMLCCFGKTSYDLTHKMFNIQWSAIQFYHHLCKLKYIFYTLTIDRINIKDTLI